MTHKSLFALQFRHLLEHFKQLEFIPSSKYPDSQLQFGGLAALLPAHFLQYLGESSHVSH